MNEEECLKRIAESKNMTIEEVKKYREYSSKTLNSEEWIEYLKLCEKAFGNSSKYLYVYEHEIKEINKGINALQQERNNYKELYEKEQEKTDKAFSWITLMLMDNDVSKEKALITIKNILGGSNE